MFGRLELSRGRGGCGVEELYGMPVLSARTDPEGVLGARRLRRAGERLRRGGVVRVLPPRSEVSWEILRPLGLRPLDPAPLLRAQAPRLALAGLERRGIDPGGATLSLSGIRTDGDMLRAARLLCPKVRRLVIDAPAGEGLAQLLREEFGIPILPPGHPAQLSLRFHPGGGESGTPALELYGQRPELDGLRLSAPALREEDREELPILCALFQWGRLGEEGLKIHRN